ncbi:hypothetical protein A2662_00615 [Candidatus Giovannonibacteria bacterium RIFCSPHIGHO2_01_FULL_45_33]|uniref:Glycine zipper 2TM domain-containing protein n=1 Tax=Candidatus Giovannonibacteria bacterium RIFCSPLOWO2_01_FULL_45_34 TaxID=1798351 RepID=A0A1F5WYY3_9BACT|nr:MAG: hypothetical protein A2662_00615 [Candidatus Giovannonibacteria bacterium RIFCSPHIGHO2_01_FULL_45_33]OGF80829.1 MAG: hypothetical protein A2930_00435 [Candidatus Giovannonibacteria bacterium RIFCSPLOWO2_01_FULL_45_34]
MKKMRFFGMLILSVFLFSACVAGPLTTREKGAGIGAVGGAAIGGILSQSWWGALLGGVLGGVGGGIIGDQLQGKDHEIERQQEQLDKNQRELDKQRKELERLRN